MPINHAAPKIEVDDYTALLAIASDVVTSAPCAFRQGNARDAARALAGLAAWVSNRTSQYRMRECMAAVASHEEAWQGPKVMRSLPTRVDGFVDEYVAMIAVVASSLVPALGERHVRAAMAWWATEKDPAAWQAIAG